MIAAEFRLIFRYLSPPSNFLPPCWPHFPPTVNLRWVSPRNLPGFPMRSWEFSLTRRSYSALKPARWRWNGVSPKAPNVMDGNAGLSCKARWMLKKRRRKVKNTHGKRWNLQKLKENCDEICKKLPDSTTWLVADDFFQLREKLEPDIGPTDWVGLGCFQSSSKQETWNHHPRIEKSKIVETAKVVSTQAGMEQGDSCPILSLPPWPRVQSPLPYHSTHLTNPKLDRVKLRRHRTRRKKTPMLVYLKELDILLNDFLWMAHQPETMMTNAGHLQNLQTLKLGTGSENMFFCIFICVLNIYISNTMISCIFIWSVHIA